MLYELTKRWLCARLFMFWSLICGANALMFSISFYFNSFAFHAIFLTPPIAPAHVPAWSSRCAGSPAKVQNSGSLGSPEIKMADENGRVFAKTPRFLVSLEKCSYHLCSAHTPKVETFCHSNLLLNTSFIWWISNMEIIKQFALCEENLNLNGKVHRSFQWYHPLPVFSCCQTKDT